MKNKFYSILLIAIAFMAIFSAKCFASSQTFFINGVRIQDGNTFDFEFDYDNQIFKLLEPEMFIDSEVWNHSNIAYAINSSNTELHIFVWDDGNLIIYSPNNDGNYSYACDSVLHTNVVYFNDYNYGLISRSFSNYDVLTSGLHRSTNIIPENFVFSSSDILDENGNVVFQGASQPTVETQGTLAKIVEEQETEKVMEEIVGILPIVIVVIVSLIAIRKAIAFLVGLLHRS